MCDYSLYVAPNRLAEEGEQLSIYRFDTGSIGFASVRDLEAEAGKKAKKNGFWKSMWEALTYQHSASLPAVCIPPGARLWLSNVPESTQRALQIGASEVVVMTEVSGQSYMYRDALVLPNKTSVLLQDLSEGIHALVLSLSSAEDGETVSDEVAVGATR